MLGVSRLLALRWRRKGAASRLPSRTARRRPSRLSRAQSKLWHSLQLPNHPTIGARSHEYHEVHEDMLIMDDLAAIQNLQLILRGIVQFHDIAFGSVKHRFQPVILIHIALAEAGVLLFGYSLQELPFYFSGKRSLQRIRSIELKSLGHARPRQAIVPKDCPFGQALHRPRGGFLHI